MNLISLVTVVLSYVWADRIRLRGGIMGYHEGDWVGGGRGEK